MSNFTLFLEKKGEFFSISLFLRNESEIEMTGNRDREVKFQKNSFESRLSQVTVLPQVVDTLLSNGKARAVILFVDEDKTR